jgi:energy-converting hydrogenase Eha subunit C
MNKTIDFLFDFSGVTEGGGIPRLNAYIKYFSNKKYEVAFIIDESLKINFDHFHNANIIFIYSRKSLIKQLFCINHEELDSIYVKVYFSFGIIKIKHPNVQINWHHISNVLPLLSIKDLLIGKMGFVLIAKSIIQRLQYIFLIKNINIISAESYSTIALYKNLFNYSKKIKQYQVFFNLSNSISNELISKYKNSRQYPLEKFAVSVGTYPYKNINKVIEIYDELKITKNITKLIIIGNKIYNKKIKVKRNDIVVMPTMARENYLDLMSNSFVYISASSYENSSVASLEGLAFSQYAILSKIDSHKEILDLNNISYKSYNKLFYEIDCNSLLEIKESTYEKSLEQVIEYIQIKMPLNYI